MILQKITFGGGECTDLYVNGGKINGSSLCISPGESASFDTYFNSFSYTKYKKYTKADSVTFSCFLEGEAEISLCTFDGTIQSTLCTYEAKNEQVNLNASFNSLPKRAILYPVIKANTESRLVWGEYTAQVEVNTNLSCAIAICTYKREACVLNNLNILSSSQFSFIKKIFVVDNGQSLNVQESTNDFISILPNKNLGGSGGFARGILEAYRGNYSHVILMDDDVVVFPEAIERLTVFISILKNEYKNAHFSAAMLPLSNPYLQYEMGACWNGKHIKSFKQNVDIRKPYALVSNLDEDEVEYGAWWCFCLPLADVEHFGLPLPLFIKFDDVEYGIRCCKNEPIITMNGVCVAHEDFDKKYSFHLEYYSLRNQLIMLACHKKQTRVGCFLRLLKVFAKVSFLYRYDTMDLMYKAFDDFLKSAEFLLSTDEEHLNRQIISMAPKAVELTAIPEWDSKMRNEYCHKGRSAFSKAIQILTLGGHLIPSCFLKKSVSAFPLPNAKVGSSYLRKTTIQYQLGSDFGYVYKRNVKSFFKYMFKTIGMSFKTFFLYGKAKRSYLKNKEYLTSINFWEKHLEI